MSEEQNQGDWECSGCGYAIHNPYKLGTCPECGEEMTRMITVADEVTGLRAEVERLREEALKTRRMFELHEEVCEAKVKGEFIKLIEQRKKVDLLKDPRLWNDTRLGERPKTGQDVLAIDWDGKITKIRYLGDDTFKWHHICWRPLPEEP